VRRGQFTLSPQPPGASSTFAVPNSTDTNPGIPYDGDDRREISVLSTIVIVLIVLWLLGMVTSYTMGGLVHILLVIAIVVVLLRIIQGRNPFRG
jgi:hypothetical protein